MVGCLLWGTVCLVAEPEKKDLTSYSPLIHAGLPQALVFVYHSLNGFFMVIDFLVPAVAFVLAVLVLSVLGKREEASTLGQGLRIVAPAIAVSVLSWFVWRFIDTTLAGNVSLPHLVNGTDAAQAKGEPAAWQGVVYFATMLAGMAAHTTWEFLPSSSRKKAVTFDKWRYVRPALVAPIIFLAVWKIVGAQTFGVQSVLLSFQNGFFWQTVMSKRT
jgi:hypothetical protein